MSQTPIRGVALRRSHDYTSSQELVVQMSLGRWDHMTTMPRMMVGAAVAWLVCASGTHADGDLHRQSDNQSRVEARIPFDAIAEPHRQRVHEIIDQPLYHRLGPVEIFPCDPKLYDWLLNDPRLVGEFWGELGVPLCETEAIAGGYRCRDDSDRVRVSFYPVHQTANLRIVYCIGQARRSPLPGWTRAEMVIVHRYRFARQADGSYFCVQQVEGFAATDRAALKAFLKIARTTGERLVDHCLQEITLYFSVPCRIIQLRPRWAKDTLEGVRERYPQVEIDELGR
jgi:hypothetical protein